MNRCQIITGDCRQALKELPSGSVHTCVTSPPYWGLRDYGHPDQIGQERTPEEYVATMVAVFREVRRVLRDDGTLWLNLGDSYAAQRGGTKMPAETLAGGISGRGDKDAKRGRESTFCPSRDAASFGLKHKDLCGIPWRVAFALQQDGWWLRSEIIFAKRNCMPESVTDRPTKSHEQIFLLTKRQHYFYDNEAVKVPASDSYANDSRWDSGGTETNYKDGYAKAMAQNPKMPHRVFNGERRNMVNLRDVWHVTLQPYSESHFAVFPEDLIKPCILAGTSAKGCCPKCGAPWERVVSKTTEMERGRKVLGLGPKTTDNPTTNNGGKGSTLHHTATVETTGWQPTCDCFLSPENVHTEPCTVLDPFSGSGTTGQVALELGRKAILIELNPKYVTLIENRTHVTPGLPLA